MMNTSQFNGDVICCKTGHSPSAFKDGNSYAFLSDQLSGVPFYMSRTSADDVNYSQAWFTHHKRREELFRPWNPTLGPSSCQWESLRLEAINNFWRAAKYNRINPVTIHLAVWLLNKLLYCSCQRNIQMTKEWFAGIVAVGFRIALKFEERPDALWGIRKIWDVLPMFHNWSGIDRRNQFLMKVESEALRMLNDLLDVPLAVQFFDKYVSVGGWPSDLVREYTDLGHFLLALSTFAKGEDHPLCDVPPSQLAAATLVLSVKIVNGDSRRSFEFYPERFAAFCQMSLKELQPVIKGLSRMLRKKPVEAEVLARVYPVWGEHEWQ